MLKLIEFIKEHNDWESLLKEKPYCLTIKRRNNFISFNYSQIDSDFYNPIVKECRGSILEDKTFKPVCIPFYKFGNYGEGYVDKIDWSTARIQEKVDGSLIKLWNYKGEWKVSTNGMIDSKDAEISSDISIYKTYYDLFMKAVKNVGLDFDSLNKDYVYMFELISPFNRVVIPYTKIEIIHIGTRDMNTLQEIEVDVGVKKPKQYTFNSLEECINSAKELTFNEEGYVVVDNQWNRVKIKSPAYVAAHHLRNNGMVTKERILDLIKLNEDEEFLSYFPEYKEYFIDIKSKYIAYIKNINKTMDMAVGKKKECPTRKEYALWATKQINSAVLFMFLDDKLNQDNLLEYINNIPSDKLLKNMGVEN